jgi:hypothetical protein
MGKHLSGAELGRLLGCSRQAIHKARMAGRIKPVCNDEFGRPLFDADVCKRSLIIDIAQTSRPSVFVGGRPPKYNPHKSHIVYQTPEQPAMSKAEIKKRITELEPLCDEYFSLMLKDLFYDDDI